MFTIYTCNLDIHQPEFLFFQLRASKSVTVTVCFLTALSFIYCIMVIVTLGIGIMPAFNNTAESKSAESSANNSDCCHEILTPFLAQMLVAEAIVLEKALSAGLKPLSLWHCTARSSIHALLVAGLFLYAAVCDEFRPFLGTWVACISYCHLLVQMHFTQAPL